MNGEAGAFIPMVKMVAALALVLGMLLASLWAARRWTGRGRAAAGSGALIRVLASQSLGPRKAVTLVRVPGQVLVLGLSTDRIDPLAQITDPDLIATIEAAVPGGSRSFADYLARL